MLKELKYKTTEKVFHEQVENNVPILSYPAFEQTGLVEHCISTRLGGVSKGIFTSMNLSFTRGDDPDDVLENYKRIADAIHVDIHKMVCSAQTHTTNVRIVKKEDAGKGVTIDRDYTDVDGLITNLPGYCLVTYYADCVPLLFLDPVNKVIASSHSGWRGTVNKMGKVTIDLMQEHFGCDPENILVGIGPSICQDCYEVSEDVIERFAEAFDPAIHAELFYKKENGKYQLNLWKANEAVLLEAGVLKDHISTTNLCTCCNPELLFSHRASKGLRGNLAAFIALKEE